MNSEARTFYEREGCLPQENVWFTVTEGFWKVGKVVEQAAFYVGGR